MAELNDKLISYGNLSTFYDKLQEQGLGGNAIEDASVLPDASENKSKLIRLNNGEKDVYAAKLLSSETTTTNRLPDEQQIDKAYLYDSEGYTYYYKGAWRFIVSDGEIDGYGWYSVIEDIAYVYVALDNAENTTSDTVFYIASYDEGCIFDLENHTVTNLNYTLAGLENDYKSTFSDSDIIPIPAIYNAPESAQIGNAYMEQGEMYKYTGIETYLNIDGVETLTYKWDFNDSGDIVSFYTTKKASEMYFQHIDRQTLYCDWHFYWEDGTEFFIGSDNGLDSIYIPQLNAPDSEQVDNAYIVSFNYDGDVATTYTYTGEQVTLIGTNGTFTAYKWKTGTSGDEDILNFSTVPANNIYCDINNTTEEIWITLYSEDGFVSNTDIWSEGTIFNSDSSDVKVWTSSYFFDEVSNPQISTVKYQRTEVTEEWDWEPLTDNATNDDIDAMFDTPAPVKRVLMKAKYEIDEETGEPSEELKKYPLSLGEGLVNENDETMEWDGDTYYKWVLYEENNEGVSSIDYSIDGEHPMIYLTTTLNPSLPFNRYSSECAYVITDGEDDYNGDAKVYAKIALIHEDGSITYEE